MTSEPEVETALMNACVCCDMRRHDDTFRLLNESSSQTNLPPSAPPPSPPPSTWAQHDIHLLSCHNTSVMPYLSPASLNKAADTLSAASSSPFPVSYFAAAHPALTSPK